MGFVCFARASESQTDGAAQRLDGRSEDLDLEVKLGLDADADADADANATQRKCRLGCGWLSARSHFDAKT